MKRVVEFIKGKITRYQNLIVLLAVAIVLTYLTEVISLTSMNATWIYRFILAGYCMLINPVQLISVIWYAALMSVVVALFNRRIFSIPIIIVAISVIFGSLYFKIKLRREAILASDLNELLSFQSLLHMIDGKIVWLFGLSILLLVAGVVVILIKNRKQEGVKLLQPVYDSVIKRIMIVVTGFFLVAGPFILPISSEGLTALSNALGKDDCDYSTIDDSIHNGAVLVFLNSANQNVMDRPDNYNQRTIEKIKDKYIDLADEINGSRLNANLRDQTVIYILSESLSNPDDVPGLKTSKNITNNIEKIKKDAVFSGKMISSGYGGGTANVEYMTLSGLPLSAYNTSMSSPYTSLPNVVNAMPTIVDLFEKSTTIHPYTGTFYNRKATYNKIGMQQFLTTDEDSSQKLTVLDCLPSSRYVSDKSAYSELLNQLDQQKSGNSFLQLITIQNHTPYVDSTGNDGIEKVIALNAVEDTNQRQQLNAYLSNVRETDKETGELVKNLNALKRPITLVFYGDHWPGVYSFVDQNKYKVTAHTTDYFIWQNDVAREVNDVKADYERNYASPSDFSSMMLKATNTCVSPYFALQTKLMEEVPAVANYTRNNDGSLTFINDSGKEINESSLSAKQRSYLGDLRNVMYDLSKGEGYLLDAEFFKVVK